MVLAQAWAMQIARRRGMKKAIVALARRLAVFVAFENAPDIDASFAVRVGQVRPVGDEAAGFGKFARHIHGRSRITRRQRDNQRTPAGEARIRAEHQGGAWLLPQACEGGFKFVIGAGANEFNREREAPSSRLETIA